MKRLLLTGIALTALAPGAMAADLSPYYKAPPPLAPAFSWTGFYIGGNAGYGWSSKSVGLDTVGASAVSAGGSNSFISGALGSAIATGMASSVPTSVLTDPHGGFGGAQLGYNWQWGWAVAGIETDLQGADIKGSNSATGVGVGLLNLPFGPPGDSQFRSIPVLLCLPSRSWIGSARCAPDSEFTLWDPHLLVYGTGGFAYGGAKADTNYSTQGCLAGILCSGSPLLTSLGATGPTGAAGSASSTLTGWAAGAGIEYAFAPGWSLKTEWLHYDLGSLTYTLQSVGIHFPGYCWKFHPYR